MRTAMSVLSLAVLAFLAFAFWVRLAPSDAARWHVDPAEAPDPPAPNFARAERVIDAPLSELRARLDAIADAEGGKRLAEDARDGAMLVTYVARTRRMRYPDYVSIRLEEAGDGTTRLRAFSRSRFGQNDMGVNKARLKRWLSRLEA